MPSNAVLRRLAVPVVAAGLLGGCGGGAGGSTEAFCDEAAEHAETFRTAGERRADPAVVGVIRDLADEAPDELRDAFETVTEASDDDELDAAIGEIEAYLVDECDIDQRP